MRLRITDTNFSQQLEWMFKLMDETGNEFYIMKEEFYKAHHLKNPVTKKELDRFDTGQWITASVREIDNKGIVVLF